MALKIVGGSFGLSGSVSLDFEQGVVLVNGTGGGSYPREKLVNVDVDQTSQAKTSWGSVLLGLLIITPLLTVFLNVVGFIIGLVLTVVGSKYTTKSHTAAIKFADGKEVRVSGTKSEINRLSSF